MLNIGFYYSYVLVKLKIMSNEMAILHYQVLQVTIGNETILQFKFGRFLLYAII